MNVVPKTGANSGFISSAGSIFENLLGGIAQSATTIGTQVLPVWVANQLELEQKDGLFQPIADNRFRPPTIESFAAPGGSVQNAGGITGNKTADIAIVLGVVGIGLIVAFKA